MKTQILDPRSSAVNTLQKIRNRYNPGSFGFDVADHAINLALSSRRKADGFLVRNTLRDSRKILTRQKKSAPIMLSLDADFEFNENDGHGRDEINLHDTCASPARSPYQICADTDYISAIRQRLSDSSPALAALDCIINGDGAADFFEQTGMSPSYFKKLKKTIQAEAAALN